VTDVVASAVVVVDLQVGVVRTCLDAAAAGAQSESCVRTFAQSAVVEGFDVTLAADCQTTSDAQVAGGTVPGALVVAEVNAYFAGMRHAGRAIGVEPSGSLALA